MPCWVLNEDLAVLTKSAIDSIRKGGDVEIIIIDNASPIGGGMLRELADIYVRNKVNLGYAKAVNQGLKLCEQGELVAVSNNDIHISPNWITVSEDILKDGSVASVHFRMIDYNQPFDLGHEFWPSGKERWCTSSFFVVRNIQLYDENFFNSCDDWDFWLRMRQKGWTTAYTNQAEYQHKDSSTVQLIPERNANDLKNREYFKQKHGILPEEEFEKRFPGELAKPWRPQP